VPIFVAITRQLVDNSINPRLKQRSCFAQHEREAFWLILVTQYLTETSRKNFSKHERPTLAMRQR
jgi:hypothetical protein